MEKYTALIVEDIKATSDYILQRIKTLCPKIGNIQQAFSIEEAYNTITANKFDIIFLDIQMPTGTSFDLLKRLAAENSINFEIIFITGESAKEYTLRAIKYSALDFLYKPLDDSELIEAVTKAIDKLSRQNYNRQVKILLDRIDSSNTVVSNKIAFHLHNSITEFVDINDVMYIEADGVISNVYLATKEKLVTNKNLGFYKEMLIVDYDFQPISNSILINKDYIKRYNHQDLCIILNNGEHLYASRRYGKELKNNLLTGRSRSLFGGLFRSFRK